MYSAFLSYGIQILATFSCYGWRPNTTTILFMSCTPSSYYTPYYHTITLKQQPYCYFKSQITAFLLILYTIMHSKDFLVAEQVNKLKHQMKVKIDYSTGIG